eukprot:TRINITY_DN37756_c0_g1_i1.p1 TRINITY_DN37756_c0_g1~~TRINITY_DN37756_c0_g1_i1.p1  ORF type:complete len:705 (+),score=165.78 TRINITY_DN37756_c0_g1_i1:137-2251(+)
MSPAPRTPVVTTASQEEKQAAEATEVVKNFLESTEGSALRAWLLHFDSNNDQKISLSEFIRGMRKLNFQGDATAIFAALDVDKSGELSLEEIDGMNAFLWQRFRVWCVSVFQNVDDMLQRMAAAGRVTVDNISRDCFCAALPKLGWECGYEDVLFTALDTDGVGFLREPALGWLHIEKRRQRRKEQAKRKAELHAASKRAQQKCKGTDAVMIDFKNFLKRKYGYYIRAWRKILSPNGAMTLQKSDLFKAVHAVGWQGDVRSLWQAFDKDESGYCSVEELDARNAMILAHFKKFIDQEFGGASGAFRAFDRLNRRRLKMSEFCAAVKMHGFTHPSVALFNAFDVEGAKSIMEEDMLFLDRWKPPAFLVATANEKAADDVKSALIWQFRNYLKAWRQVLDVDDSNHCNWDEFAQACEKINYNGDVAGAWRALDADLSGFITLRELDAEASDTLETFKRWCDEEFGGVRSAFGVFDADGSNEVTYREFRRSCRIYGFEGNVHTLFHALDVERNGVLSVDEVAFLDDWVFAERDGSDAGVGSAEALPLPPTVAPVQDRNSLTTTYVTDTPGPAAYETPTTVGAGPMLPMVRFAGAYSFRKRLRGAQLPRLNVPEPSPAPGQYDDILSCRAAVWQSRPSYGFGSQPRQVAEPALPASSKLPGPGSYTLPRTRTQQAICMPRRPLKAHPLLRGAPGPVEPNGGLPLSARF